MARRAQMRVGPVVEDPERSFPLHRLNLVYSAMTSEPLPAGVGSAQLTEALRRAGALPADASVREITVESARSTILSCIFRLRLGYDCLAPDAPTSIILKTALPERSGSEWNAGRREVAFYNEVAAAMPVRLVPRCFEAHWDAETEAWRLLKQRHGSMQPKEAQGSEMSA